MDKNEIRDLSGWRLAKFDKICANIIVSKQQIETDSSCMCGSFFLFEEARMVYHRFVRIDTNTQDGPGNSYLMRLDARHQGLS